MSFEPSPPDNELEFTDREYFITALAELKSSFQMKVIFTISLPVTEREIIGLKGASAMAVLQYNEIIIIVATDPLSVYLTQ